MENQLCKCLGTYFIIVELDARKNLKTNWKGIGNMYMEDTDNVLVPSYSIFFSHFLKLFQVSLILFSIPSQILDWLNLKLRPSTISIGSQPNVHRCHSMPKYTDIMYIQSLNLNVCTSIVAYRSLKRRDKLFKFSVVLNNKISSWVCCQFCSITLYKLRLDNEFNDNFRPQKVAFLPIWQIQHS